MISVYMSMGMISSAEEEGWKCDKVSTILLWAAFSQLSLPRGYLFSFIIVRSFLAWPRCSRISSCLLARASGSSLGSSPRSTPKSAGPMPTRARAAVLDLSLSSCASSCVLLWRYILS